MATCRTRIDPSWSRINPLAYTVDMDTAAQAHPPVGTGQSAGSGLHWSNRFQRLGLQFYTEWAAEGLPQPYWVACSEACARDMGWPTDWADDASALSVFSGNAMWDGMRPLASVYSGHQFGVWAGQLGDGRALWLGEIDSPAGPLELQLKGAGPTPYSRRGDGRAVLRSSIREFLCSEAMQALGIPTTRALCLTGSALPVRRETWETAAVVTRVAPSFIRFGHFEHFAANQQPVELRALADFVIDHHYPDCREAAAPYAALLRAVTLRTAELMAQWQAVGFCHGVMNTDNMSVLGLTIDYGPFGFLDAYDPDHICNHSDTGGRYAYSQQPQAAWWNLHAFAHALQPLIDDRDAAANALAPYTVVYEAARKRCFNAKLGLIDHQADDVSLAEDWLQLMAANAVDYTITWRRLAQFNSDDGARNDAVRDLFIDRDAFDAWGARYRQRLRAENSFDAQRAAGMNRINPRFVLRNHLAEAAIEESRNGDFNEVHRLMSLLQQPFDEQADAAAYADFPPAWAQQLDISCSS